MSGSRWLGLLIAFVIGFLLLFVVRIALAASGGLGSEPNVYKAVRTGPHTAALNLSVWPDSLQCHGGSAGSGMGMKPGGGPHPDWVTYCPSTSLEVPAHTIVTVTIHQYDAGDPVHNKFFEKVQGTIGNVATFNGKTKTGLISHENNNLIAHTFTVESIPNSPAQMFLSVPLESVLDQNHTPVQLNGGAYSKPSVIKFKFNSGVPGKYIWKCYDPCGSGLYGTTDLVDNFGGAMATTGYMDGTLTVVGH